MKTRHKMIAAISVLLVGMTAISASAVAYWTEEVPVTVMVEGLTMGIEAETKLQFDDENSLVPGDTVGLTWTVVNTGDVSADIKPVIRISSSEPMKKSAYEILGADGKSAASEFEVRYYLGRNEVSENADFDSITYTKKDFTTLAGEKQTEDIAFKDGQSVRQTDYKYQLKLSENCPQSYQGADVEISIRTYAIQHRYTDEIKADQEWMEAME